MRGTGRFCAGEAGCRENRADGNGADGHVGWGGREGERRIGAAADGSPVDATPGDWREEKLDGLVSLLCVRGISRRVRPGWEVVRMRGLIEYESK